MKIIRLNLDENSYPIIINEGKFKPLTDYIKKMALGNFAFIITNEKIYKLYAAILQNELSRIGVTCFFYKVKDSEKSKSLSIYIKTINKISQIDTKKHLFLIAFGGGVIGDLTGFVAATYKRGVDYIQIPTTLLAQVDSSIGGKTAIDLPAGKNLIGAFFQPRIVYSNITLLKSLPKRQLKSGLAELVKYGVIANEKLFIYLEKNYRRLLEGNKTCLEYVIYCASKIKAKIVECDEKETKGLRTILNFGHTIGHAVETATKYANLTHGEAISIGMASASEIASKVGIFDQKSHNRIENLLLNIKLPNRAKRMNFKAILEAFYRDKKFIHGKIRMVLPTRIGHVIVTEDIPITMVKNVIKERTG